MLNLNDREWKAFNLIDDNMFYIDEVKTFKSTALVESDGVFDIVGATSKNNGNVGFLPKQYYDYLINGNCICLIKTGQGSVGDAVYKQGAFIPSNNVCVIRSSWLNRHNGMFIVAEINKQADRYSYGYIRNNSRIRKEQLMLPTADDGQPDYAFMEQYIKERESNLKQKYVDFVNAELSTSPTPLVQKEWKEFSIADIFDIKAGKRLTTADMDSGNIPFIGATELNNGVTNWINTPNETLDYNVLGVNYNGSVAEAFYHPYCCVFSDDVKRLHLKNADDGKYILLFCSMLIRKQKVKYTYGYKFNGNRMARQKILLPITDDGSPDYEYMTQYAKAVMFGKNKKYLDYQKCPLL